MLLLLLLLLLLGNPYIFAAGPYGRNSTHTRRPCSRAVVSCKHGACCGWVLQAAGSRQPVVL
jgi:hypothetical protein